MQDTEKNIFLNVNSCESRSTLSSCKSCIFFPTSVWAAASSFSAWDRWGHQPVAKHVVSYEGPAWIFTYSVSRCFSTLTLVLRLFRQQKTQQGNQLAKETDRLMKAFCALPVSPDQVLISLIPSVIAAQSSSCWYPHGFSMVSFSTRRLDLHHMVRVTQFCFVPFSSGTDPNCNMNVSAGGEKKGARVRILSDRN